MAHASDVLISIRKEIERIEANISILEKKINENELNTGLSVRVGRWEEKLKEYEDKLEKARTKEQQALGFQAHIPPPAVAVPEGLVAFHDAVMCVPLDSFNAGQVISLDAAQTPIKILDHASFRSQIFVHPNYVRLLEHIFEIINKLDERKPRVAVLGNPGTGKTYFGLYALAHCMRNGMTVVYESASINRRFMFSPVGIKIFSTRDDPAFMEALHNFNTIYIVDGVVPIIEDARTILVTSPKHEIFHAFATKHTAPAVPLYMPTWSFDELAALRAAVFPDVDQRDMEGLFVRWGGIPRSVLEDAAANKLSWERYGVDALQTAIGSCRINDIVEAVKEGSEFSGISHRVLHVQCDDELQFRMVGYVFASDYVRDRVLRRLVQQERHRLLMFATFAGDTSMNGGLRGQVFKYFAHAWLASGTKVFPIRALNGPALADNNPTITWNRLSVHVFHKGTSELPKRPLPALTYIQPESRSFAAVDAIISPGDNSEPVLLLQMAVGADHPISASRLNALLNSVKPVSALFFVVPRDRYHSYTEQSYYDLDGHVVTPSLQVATLPQFALCIDLVEEALGEALDAMSITD